MRKRWIPPAFVLAALVAVPATAAGVRIRSVDTSAYPQVRVTVVTSGGTSAPRLDEDGGPAAGLRAVNLAAAKSIVLAVDRSRSMAGAKLTDATAAARAFLAHKGPLDRVEVVAFGHQAVQLTTFSSSTADADAALRSLEVDPRQGTALWDAIVRGAEALSGADDPGRVIVVVTDGADVSSTSSFADAVAAARRAHAGVYAIGIAGSGYRPGPLRALAKRTGGAYLEASSSAKLTRLYEAIRRSLAHTWQLQYVTAARPGATLRLAAVVPGVGTDSRTVRVDASGLGGASAAAHPSVLPASVWRASWAPAAIAGCVGFLVLLACWFVAAARSGSWLRSRLAPHLGPKERPTRAKRHHQGGAALRSILAWTDHAFANVKQFRALQQLLTRADLPLLASELVYLCAGAAILVAIVAAVASAPWVLVVFLTLLGGSAPLFWVGAKARARMKLFDNQLPDLLITIAASLKAGHSFRHAIQAVVDEGAEPTARELQRVLTETRLGRPMDDALAEMGERIGSKNLSFVLNAVTIQRQIGGTLAGLFDMVAETVRQRQQFTRKIRSLTAMGRMSAYVLAGLPVGVALLISVISPSYMQPLWHTTTGHALVAGALGMMAIGSLLLRKVVSFKG